MVRSTFIALLLAVALVACGNGSGRDFGNTRTPTFGSQAVVTGGTVRGSGGD